MRAYIYSGIKAASMRRIVQAIGRHAPRHVTFVPTRDLADLVVHTVVGVQNFHKTDVPDLIAEDRLAGRLYAVVQCCLASTERPDPAFWLPLWKGAAAVWSYLDLYEFAGRKDFPFIHEPLGADPDVFSGWVHGQLRPFDLLTSGYVAESEGVKEGAEAVKIKGGKHVHLGPDLGLGDHSTHVSGITDKQLAQLYARCRFVAGLRRCEGFELPAAEGLLCGARPIMFDQPHYKRWFGDWARYVPEADQETVTRAIAGILSDPYEPVTDVERQTAVSMFSWERVVGKFWDRIEANMGVVAA